MQLMIASMPGVLAETTMRIAKPLLLIITPIGVVGAVYEAFRQTGGLGFLLVMLMLFMGISIGSLVLTIRKEQRLASAVEAEITRGIEP